MRCFVISFKEYNSFPNALEEFLQRGFIFTEKSRKVNMEQL